MSSNQDIIFLSNSIFYSKCRETNLGIQLDWKPWRLRKIEIDQYGILTVKLIDSESDSKKEIIREKYLLDNVEITELYNSKNNKEREERYVWRTSFIGESIEEKDEENEVGLLVKCLTLTKFPTKFRIILNENDKNLFYSCIKKINKINNLDSIQLNSISSHFDSSSTSNSSNNYFPSLFNASNQSLMRKAFSSAMDKYEYSERKKYILKKRGAFKFLPIYFENDLVNGSWWFLLGSIIYFIFSLLMFINTFDNKLIGEIDTILSTFRARAAWILMTICGLFFTLGSICFMRAVHFDPPMRPLLPFLYHFQNDELLGSWLYFFGTLPFIPYILIYVAASHEGLIYLIAFPIVLVCVYITYLFVESTYPRDQNEECSSKYNYVKKLTQCMFFCCSSKRWREEHLKNNWLSGCWALYAISLILFIVSILSLLSVLVNYTFPSFFVNFSNFLVYSAFLIGSAYFVSGSYEEDDDYEDEYEVENEESKENFSPIFNTHNLQIV